MTLQRENILTLIGNGKYHSAILTTFSFDFYFFEMKAMKWLRSCGVRNVNVLIDGHYYSELMQQAGGEEMQLSPSYSLYPVFHKSIFHPKIWMLFGEKEGLLIVGSGNLTNSGNGTNDEIWGAFHFDINMEDNALLFSAAWTYVQQLCSSVKGFMHEKTTRWVIDHCKWLNELPEIKPFQFVSTSGKERIAFLNYTADSSIWTQMSNLIGKEAVIEITTLSPFYDTNGKAIQALALQYPSAKINVVIDESGSIPKLLPESKTRTFYNWYDSGVSKPLHSKAGHINNQSKLHAKIIHLRTSSGREFCLFGSANVTPEGLGLLGTTSNNEVSLLIQSDEGGLLNRLGIKLKTPVKLSDFKTDINTSIYDSILKHNRYNIKLLSAEWVCDELYLYVEGNYANPLVAKLYDDENRLLFSIKIGEFKLQMRTKPVDSLAGSHHLQLFDATNDIAVSNIILLADYYLLAKTHPNPMIGEFDDISEQIHSGDLTKVFDLLHYAMLDESESGDSTNLLSKTTVHVVKGDEKQGPDKMYDLSAYKPIEHNSFEKSLLISSLSLRVLDVLKFIRSKEFKVTTQAELRIDEQEPDLGNTSGVDDNEIKKELNISLASLKSEKKKLNGYFDDLCEHQQFLLYSNDRPKDYRPTLTDLTKFLIALELILEFGGKSEKYTDMGKEHFFIYLEYNSEEPYYNDGVKGCCLNIIGDFLMLINHGFKEYEFEYTATKMKQLKFEALITSIVCTLNTKWNENELHYLNSLLLNCLHYLGEKDPETFNESLPLLKEGIARKISELKNPSAIVSSNFLWFEKRIIPAFEKTIRKIAAKQFDTTSAKGLIVYKSPWGYCFVKDVSQQNEFMLIRPGFMWDDTIGDFVMHNNDEEYHPIKFRSLISVEI